LSISPVLPAGLTFNTTDGTISGTPTVASTPAVYGVTAANSGGSVTTSLTIAVASAPLLDLGHADPVEFIRTTSSRVLSLDSAGHWILQDYSAGTTLASGDSGCGAAGCSQFVPGSAGEAPIYLPIDIAGTVMIDGSASGVELRSSADGHLLTSVAGQYAWWQLASDGSYFCGGTSTALTAWSAAGQVIVTKSGDYSKALTFAAPGQILVGNGAAGQSVIETISVATGTSSLGSAFQGQFGAWFSDGSAFLTTLVGGSTGQTTVWTYSNASVQQGGVAQVSGTASNVHGIGNWWWAFDPLAGALSLYQVGSSGSPVLSNNYGIDSNAVVSGSTIGVLVYGTGQLTIINLSGNTPATSTYTVPSVNLETYAAIPGGAWVTGNTWGVLFDGATEGATQPRYLTLGTAWSIAGGTNYFSVAVASGKIFNYDASNNTLVSTINFSASQLAASSSGAVLAAAADYLDGLNVPSRSLSIYSLPAGDLTTTFTYVAPTSATLAMAVSAAGDMLAAQLSNTSGCGFEVVDIAGGASLLCGPAAWSGRALGNLQLSPDGTLVLASSGPLLQPTTDIYKNGSLVTTVAASGTNWLDNTRFLANTFIENIGGEATYTGTVIYDSSGNMLSKPSLPELDSLDVVTSDTIYGPASNSIYSVTSAMVTWASANPNRPVGNLNAGAIGGSEVVFSSGSLVLAEPYSPAQ
jgi:Putative Ig domain